MRLGRLWVDIICLFAGHRWGVDVEVDAGRGYCGRCGKNDHVWLPVPSGHALWAKVSPEWRA